MTEPTLSSSAVPEVVDELYGGTLDPAAWDRALLHLADVVRASGAMLFAFNPQSGAVLRDENHRVDPQVVQDYAQYWTFEDARLKHSVAVPAGIPMTELTLGIPDFHRSPILHEFLLPADSPHFMAAWLGKSPHKAVAISLLGTRRRGAFQRTDFETLGRVLPHLTRALEIRDRLEAAQMRADMLASSLDGISFGVLLLDARGKLLEANAVGQEALRPENGLSRRNDGTLKLREPAGAQFAKWLGSGTPPPENADGLLHIERVGAQRLSLLLTRLPHMGTAWMREDPRWMILIFDLERSIQARLHLIEQDLRVSTREAEVAGLLFAGLSLSEISQRLGVSTHTVRSQIKSIFRKTGTQSQSDLIRRIALGPAVSSSRHTVVTPPSKT